MRKDSRRRAAVLLGLGTTALLLVAAGPGLNGFEISRHRVPRDQILPGGPMRDAIRAVDRPSFASVDAAQTEGWVRDDLPVVGLEHKGEARAYPIFLIEWHQVVNDRVGGEAIAVTFGPLAGTPRAYRREVDGRPLRFGVSGLVYNANFLMYDRETESLWSQFLGLAISGPFAGRVLEGLPVRQESFGAWRARYPKTRVLRPPEEERIAYAPEASQYEPYWIDDKPPFPVEAEDRRFHAKELILGIEVDGEARAYLGSIVARAGGRVEDRLAGRPIRIEFSPEDRAFRYEVPEGVAVTDAYWFAWKAFHPDTDVWRDPGRVPGRER